MKYISVCSGIEAATAAWHSLGWQAAWYSEIEAFPSAVLAHHYPNTPNRGDMTKYLEWPDATIDLLVGGTPCQSFSVAGLRKGLADPRGNLMLTYLAIADQYRPRWLVWENVPGVLSSGGGRDFGTLLGGLGQLGYGFAYRVLDAQYFGVAQRRRRVFVVGCLGDWRSAAAVLFERHSLSGHPAPRREAGKGVAGTLKGGSGSRGYPDPSDGNGGGLIASPHAEISPAIKARDSKGVSSDGDGDGAILVPMVAHSLKGEGFDASEDGTGRGTPLVPVAHCDVMPTLMNGANTPAGHNARSGHTKDSYVVPVMTLAIRGRGNSHELEYRTDGTANALLTPNGGRGGIGVGAVAFAQNSRDEVREMPYVGALAAEAGMKQTSYIRQAMQVRRLTPRECERLQGFEDDYTLITVRGKPAADGPRYKALGNSMAVPVMHWIGKRIEAVESMTANLE